MDSDKGPTCKTNSKSTQRSASCMGGIIQFVIGRCASLHGAGTCRILPGFDSDPCLVSTTCTNPTGPASDAKAFDQWTRHAHKEVGFSTLPGPWVSPFPSQVQRRYSTLQAVRQSGMNTPLHFLNTTPDYTRPMNLFIEEYIPD